MGDTECHTCTLLGCPVASGLCPQMSLACVSLDPLVFLCSLTPKGTWGAPEPWDINTAARQGPVRLRGLWGPRGLSDTTQPAEWASPTGAHTGHQVPCLQLGPSLDLPPGQEPCVLSQVPWAHRPPHVHPPGAPQPGTDGRGVSRLCRTSHCTAEVTSQAPPTLRPPLSQQGDRRDGS